MKPWREFYNEYFNGTDEQEDLQPGHRNGVRFIYIACLIVALAWFVAAVRG